MMQNELFVKFLKNNCFFFLQLEIIAMQYYFVHCGIKWQEIMSEFCPAGDRKSALSEHFADNRRTSWKH